MKRTLIALLLMSTSAFAVDHRDAAKAALQALGELAKLSPDSVGLTQAEASAATVDDGIRVMHIGLRDLRKYQGGDPHKLLIDAQTTLYGVRVGGVLKSEITIAATDHGPQPVELGNLLATRSATQITQSSSRANWAQTESLSSPRGIGRTIRAFRLQSRRA
jgi:hypothetical protein